MKSRCVIPWLAVLVLAFAALGCSDLPGEDGTTAPGPSGTSSSSSAVETTSGPTTSFAPPTLEPTTTTLPTPQEAILQEMTLRQKAAQVLLLGFEGTTLIPSTQRLLADGPPGGLLLLGRNVTGAEQLTELTTALQEAAAAGGAQVGLFIAADQEGGLVQRIHDGVPEIPAARALGEDFSPLEIARLATETATGLLELGVNMNLAPVADVVSDPDSFLYARTYSGDPTVVADCVATVTEAFVRSGLIAVVKHFPGHGSAAGNTHGEIVISEASQAEFATVHIPPFKAGFAAGAECVMIAHIVAEAYDPDRPASLSPRVVDDLLREGLGFSGLVVTDDLEMVAAAGTPSDEGAGFTAKDPGELAVLALEAGCDLLISTGTLERQESMIVGIVEAVQTGRLPESRLDEAVLRMLEIKLRHGIVFP